jgi:hypothetical protein
MDNPYKVLQVDPSAEPEVIEAAYRRLVRKYHPDVNPAPEAGARMRQLIDAYAILRDPTRRAAFDRQRVAPWLRWRWPWPWQPRRHRPGRGPRPPDGRPLDGVEGPWSDRQPCSRHVGRPAVGACRACGSSLCGPCVSLFQPAGCAACVWQWAWRAQLRAGGAIGGFAAAFGLVLTIALGSARAQLGVGLLSAYLVSATALGIAVVAGRMWRTGWHDEPQDKGLGVAFLVWAGLLIGWIGTPVLLVKMVRDLDRGRRLAAIAGHALVED